MYIKLIGAVLVVASCGYCGFLVASNYRKQVTTLSQLVYLMDYMECELQYHYTPLPQLCRQTAAEGKGILRQIFHTLAICLEDQITPDVSICMEQTISHFAGCPSQTLEVLRLLGHSIGRFDMDGQLKALEYVRAECRKRLEKLTKNQDAKLRSYQTLGLCAGAALCILFI